MSQITKQSQPDFVARLGRSGLSGDGPLPEFSHDELAKLRGSRATAQKVSGWILTAAPISETEMLVYGYRALPKGVALTDLIRLVQQDAEQEKPSQDVSGRFGAASLFLARLPVKKRLPQLLYALRDQGIPGVAAMIHLRQGKIKRTYFASPEFRKIKDDLATMIAQDDGSDLDLRLTAQKIGGQSGRLLSPPDRDNGIAFFVTDPSPAADAMAVPSALIHTARTPERFSWSDTSSSPD